MLVNLVMRAKCMTVVSPNYDYTISLVSLVARSRVLFPVGVVFSSSSVGVVCASLSMLLAVSFCRDGFLSRV